ncbi:MAG: L,D-transpeptidase family protein [Desulfuromonadales bacterium]|nr:L,D-transpeptidase family protein [Desulfuromonadales bacterium]
MRTFVKKLAGTFACPVSALLLVLLLLPQGLGAEGLQPVQQDIRDILQRQFETGSASRVFGNPILTDKLALFYQGRDFVPLWIGSKGVIPEADSLFAAIVGAERQGLAPADYHLDALIELLPQSTAASLAELEVLLTDAFLRYCKDIRLGRADPRNADPEWFILIDRIDHLAALEQALSRGTFASTLQALPPRDPAYRRLLSALADYRRIAEDGGWPVLAMEETLREDDRGEAVIALRERLRLGGDFSGASNSEEFDPELTEAVKSFQARHGLEIDGVVGASTRAALNVPIAERIRQILLNLERWRWMPRDLPERYLLVNMAGFELKAIDNFRSLLQMRVIVGREYRQTPAFSEPIRYLVINPFWNIPPSLAVKDILPKVRRNRSYLQREGIRVFRDWSAESPELDPAAIDWDRLTSGRFPYKLRQDPGPRNALGRIKFMLPNTFNVYLHDTPDRGLFDKAVRTFSSGCIRLEDPLGLAEYLLADNPDWSREQIDAAVDRERRQIVSLKTPHPVYMVYWTVWVDEQEKVQFRPDVYRRDARLQKSMDLVGGGLHL